MKAFALLTLSSMLMFSSPVARAAEPAARDSSVRIEWNQAGTKVIVKMCDPNAKCEVMGNVDGYDPKDFSFHPMLRKGLAVALGDTDEVAVVGVAVVALFVTLATGGWDAPTGAVLAPLATGGTTFLVGEGTIYGVDKLVNDANPVRQWEKADFSAALETAVRDHQPMTAPIKASDLSTKKALVLEILKAMPSNFTHAE